MVTISVLSVIYQTPKTAWITSKSPFIHRLNGQKPRFFLRFSAILIWHTVCTVIAYRIAYTVCAYIVCVGSLTDRQDRFLTAFLNRSQIGLDMLTPGQIAKSLDVSPATVRRWSARYARHLSPHTPGKTRAYTVDDLAILTRVRDLSRSGTPLAKIDQDLAVVDVSAESTALITVNDFALSLQTARDQIANLQNQLDTQTARLDAVTAWIALPFWKRLFTKPPAL